MRDNYINLYTLWSPTVSEKDKREHNFLQCWTSSGCKQRGNLTMRQKQNYNTVKDCNSYLAPSVPVHFPPAQSAILCSHWGFPQTGCYSAAPPLFSSVAPPCDTRQYIIMGLHRRKPLISLQFTQNISLRLSVTNLTHDCQLQWQVLHLHKVFLIRLLTGVTWAHLLKNNKGAVMPETVIWVDEYKCNECLTSTLIITGESVSVLLVVADSLGTSQLWQTAEFPSEGAAASALVSPPGVWLATSHSTSVESTVPTDLLISAKKINPFGAQRWTNKGSTNTRSIPGKHLVSSLKEISRSPHHHCSLSTSVQFVSPGVHCLLSPETCHSYKLRKARLNMLSNLMTVTPTSCSTCPSAEACKDVWTSTGAAMNSSISSSSFSSSPLP